MEAGAVVVTERDRPVCRAETAARRPEMEDRNRPQKHPSPSDRLTFSALSTATPAADGLGHWWQLAEMRTENVEHFGPRADPAGRLERGSGRLPPDCDRAHSIVSLFGDPHPAAERAMASPSVPSKTTCRGGRSACAANNPWAQLFEPRGRSVKLAFGYAPLGRCICDLQIATLVTGPEDPNCWNSFRGRQPGAVCQPVCQSASIAIEPFAGF